jgi:uncharacterized iron-regulated membrane protein
MAPKAALKTIHTWIGIAAGVFLSLIALTGSVILFRAEFQRAALPPGAAAGDGSRRASLDDAAREIAKLRPGAVVRRVQIPAESGEPYILQVQSPGKRMERFAVDSASARVLGTIQPNWMDWMVDLHRNLLAGRTGRSIVGGFGVMLFVLSASSLLLWLAGPRNWRAWFSVRRQGSRVRFNYELHRAAGLWACVVLALISLTGIGLAYPNTFRDAIQSLTGEPATVRAPKSRRSATRLPLDQYVRLGRAAMSDGVPTEMRLPEGAKGPVDLRLYRAGDLAASGNHVYLDPGTGSVLMVDRIVDRPIGARFLAAVSPLHYAQFGGIGVRIAWALFGLAPLLLFVTGLFVWWNPARVKSPRPTPEPKPKQEVFVG